MPETPPAARIPDSHKNAFWIYGVTAMIMREPLSLVVRRLSVEGIQDPVTQVQCLRALLILLILSRQFLTAGSFFDRVYLQPDSAARFPRRSYPWDFLTRMAELLVAVAASTTIALESTPPRGLAPFTILAAILLLLEAVWWATARVATFSTVVEIAPTARANGSALLLCVALYGSLRALGVAVETSDALLLSVVTLFTGFQLAGQVRSYG